MTVEDTSPDVFHPVARGLQKRTSGAGLSLARTARAGALLGYLAGLTGCVPERSLSSYQQPGETEARADIGSSIGSSLPDASIVDGGRRRVPPDASASLDAGPEPSPTRLMCRSGCACESSTLGELMFCTTPVSHDEALAACSLAGGSLVSIDDPIRNAEVSARMAALAADDFWLSGTDAEDEGVWRWSDGRVFFEASADAGAPRPYAPWDEGQPNDLNGEDCMRSTGGVWRDLDCSEQIAFVCQG